MENTPSSPMIFSAINFSKQFGQFSSHHVYPGQVRPFLVPKTVFTFATVVEVADMHFGSQNRVFPTEKAASTPICFMLQSACLMLKPPFFMAWMMLNHTSRDHFNEPWLVYADFCQETHDDDSRRWIHRQWS